MKKEKDDKKQTLDDAYKRLFSEIKNGILIGGPDRYMWHDLIKNKHDTPDIYKKPLWSFYVVAIRDKRFGSVVEPAVYSGGEWFSFASKCRIDPIAWKEEEPFWDGFELYKE